MHKGAHLASHIQGTIEADELVVGHGVVVERGVEIRGRRVVLGDCCYIGVDVTILVDEFEIGDYTKLHARSFAHGSQPMSIGRNCWIGGGVVLDSNGGLQIGHGVGIGSGSQLWTHIRHGDVVQGCRWNSTKPMIVGDDAWFVGHCLVSPVRVGERAMAMLGSTITRDMEPNHVYAGTPARDITEKVGPQFEALTPAERQRRFEALLDAFYARHPEHRGWTPTVDLGRRTYRKELSVAEITFFRETVPIVKLHPDEAQVGAEVAGTCDIRYDWA